MMSIFLYIEILSAGIITVNSPNGGENLELNSFSIIRWNTIGLTNNVKITLWKNNQLLGLIVKINHPSQSQYNWQVGSYQGGVAVPGNDYKIRIREQGGVDFTTNDESNNNFSIYAAMPQKADLLINGKMTRTPKHPGEGERFKFKFCVANSGRNVANASKAELIVTGPGGFFKKRIIDVKQLAGGVGDHQYFYEDFRLWNMGIYRFKVRLDISHAVEEDDERNNEKFILIDINPRPDLIVCLEQNKRVQMTSGKLSVHAYVKNIGNFKSHPCVLRFYIKQHGAKSINIPALAPNYEIKVSRRHRWLTKGHKKISAKIDYMNVVKEKMEDNNRVESSIYVYLPHENKYVVAKPRICSRSTSLIRLRKK